MSIRVKRRLDALKIVTSHEERLEIDKEIELKTKEYCDKGVAKISDSELTEIVEQVKRRRRKPLEVYA